MYEFDLETIRQKVVETYKEEQHIQNTADKLNLNYHVVSFFLKYSKVKLAKKGSTKKRIELPMKELKELYLYQNYTLFDLAVKYNVSEQTIAVRLKEMEIKLKGHSSKTSHLSVEQVRSMYWDVGFTMKEIALRCNVSEGLIAKFMKDNNIPTRGVKKLYEKSNSSTKRC